LKTDRKDETIEKLIYYSLFVYRKGTENNSLQNKFNQFKEQATWVFLEYIILNLVTKHMDYLLKTCQLKLST